MSMEGFEVAVVGAGPAGSAAALTLAKEGVQVLLLERGSFPGSKNVFGGRIYTYALKRLLGDRWKQAPIERFIRKEGITFMTNENSFTVEFESKETQTSFTAIRAMFDKWLAEEAEKAGASLINDVRVDDLMMNNGQVKGIVAGQDKIAAEAVIACDGTTTNLARKAGLITMLNPEEISIGMKDVTELPAETIEERLGLESGEGMAHVYAGYPTKGLRGGGFLYTNKNSLALGLVVGGDDVILEARKKKDYSANSLRSYTKRLKSEPSLKDMYTFSKVPNYLRNRRLYSVYPELVCSAAEAVYRVDSKGKRKIYKELRAQTKGRVSTLTLIRDLLRGARTF